MARLVYLKPASNISHMLTTQVKMVILLSLLHLVSFRTSPTANLYFTTRRSTSLLGQHFKILLSISRVVDVSGNDDAPISLVNAFTAKRGTHYHCSKIYMVQFDAVHDLCGLTPSRDKKASRTCLYSRVYGLRTLRWSVTTRRD